MWGSGSCTFSYWTLGARLGWGFRGVDCIWDLGDILCSYKHHCLSAVSLAQLLLQQSVPNLRPISHLKQENPQSVPRLVARGPDKQKTKSNHASEPKSSRPPEIHRKRYLHQLFNSKIIIRILGHHTDTKAKTSRPTSVDPQHSENVTLGIPSWLLKSAEKTLSLLSPSNIRRTIHSPGNPLMESNPALRH